MVSARYFSLNKTTVQITDLFSFLFNFIVFVHLWSEPMDTFEIRTVSVELIKSLVNQNRHISKSEHKPT